MSRTAATSASSLLLCLALLATTGSAGQTWSPPQSPNPVDLPRMLDGRPDFQGVWSFATLTPLERRKDFAESPFLTDAEAAEFVQRQLAAVNTDGRPQSDYNEFWFERPSSMARLNGRNLTSRIIDPADGRIPPLTRQAQDRLGAVQKAQREHPADGPEDRSMSERCLSPTPLIEPAGGGNNNFVQIVQTSDQLVLFTELMSVRRIIPISGREHLPGSIRLSSGDSRARWEGDKLLVDTTNYIGRFDFAFTAIDDNLHLLERFQLVDPNTLLLEETIDDSTAFTKPWTVVLPMTRTDMHLFEYACHEGNYALKDILSGARAEEAERSRGPR
jgi:hypothetical protein